SCTCRPDDPGYRERNGQGRQRRSHRGHRGYGAGAVYAGRKLACWRADMERQVRRVGTVQQRRLRYDHAHPGHCYHGHRIGGTEGIRMKTIDAVLVEHKNSTATTLCELLLIGPLED